MPPAGQSADDFRLGQRARDCFFRLFEEQPEEVTVESGRVKVTHMDEQFVYDSDQDVLVFHPRDNDGNAYGRPVEIRTVQQAVHALEGHGSVDKTY